MLTCIHSPYYGTKEYHLHTFQPPVRQFIYLIYKPADSLGSSSVSPRWVRRENREKGQADLPFDWYSRLEAMMWTEVSEICTRFVHGMSRVVVAETRTSFICESDTNNAAPRKHSRQERCWETKLIGNRRVILFW